MLTGVPFAALDPVIVVLTPVVDVWSTETPPELVDVAVKDAVAVTEATRSEVAGSKPLAVAVLVVETVNDALAV